MQNEHLNQTQNRYYALIENNSIHKCTKNEIFPSAEEQRVANKRNDK